MNTSLDKTKTVELFILISILNNCPVHVILTVFACSRCNEYPFLLNRYDMPDGYIAVSHVVSNLVKKAPLRLSSCWTPISGSFESIVEEDEEVNDDEELEAIEVTKTDKTGMLIIFL